jgi:hypothetical protein
MPLSPYQYALQYLNLRVPLGDGTAPVTVSVADYQNPGPNWFVKVVPAAHWSKVQNKFEEHIKTRGRVLYGQPIPESVAPEDTQLVHKGAGSPAQIRAVLQLVYLYWKELHLGPTPNLQWYVKQFIGLYCTGLVGNYATEALGCVNKGPQTATPAFAPAGRRRLSPGDVQRYDVLVWKSGGHIAVVNAVLGELSTTGGALWVAESSSDGDYHGLTAEQENRYRVRKVMGDVFVVTRGLKHYAAAVGASAGVPGGVEVYIASAFV